MFCMRDLASTQEQNASLQQRIATLNRELTSSRQQLTKRQRTEKAGSLQTLLRLSQQEFESLQRSFSVERQRYVTLQEEKLSLINSELEKCRRKVAEGRKEHSKMPKVHVSYTGRKSIPNIVMAVFSSCGVCCTFCTYHDWSSITQFNDAVEQLSNKESLDGTLAAESRDLKAQNTTLSADYSCVQEIQHELEKKIALLEQTLQNQDITSRCGTIIVHVIYMYINAECCLTGELCLIWRLS